MINLAIIGATGLVGQEVIEVLDEEGLLYDLNLTLFASEKNSGKRYFFKGNEFNILELSEKNLTSNFDVAIFSSGTDVSFAWVERFAAAGTCVIDNSSAFRQHNNVPLVVPEINFDDVKKNYKIISNPNCSTTQLAIVLNKLRRVCEIEQIVVSTYQSVSGAGKSALFDLKNDTNNFYKMGIKNNIIPYISEFDENGNCEEENKIMFELNKILKSQIKICATTVRVPIERCHGESVYVKFKNNVKIEQIKNELKCEYIAVKNDKDVYPSNCTNTNLTYVCRLRQISDNEIMFFVLADNLRRGAAFNAVLILKKLLDKQFV